MGAWPAQRKWATPSPTGFSPASRRFLKPVFNPSSRRTGTLGQVPGSFSRCDAERGAGRGPHQDEGEQEPRNQATHRNQLSLNRTPRCCGHLPGGLGHPPIALQGGHQRLTRRAIYPSAGKVVKCMENPGYRIRNTLPTRPPTLTSIWFVALGDHVEGDHFFDIVSHGVWPVVPVPPIGSAEGPGPAQSGVTTGGDLPAVLQPVEPLQGLGADRDPARCPSIPGRNKRQRQASAVGAQ